ncbi:MAG: DegT/DnrJ/EryC1/StrS family aminotransferase [SAR324 cluster bacterium]|nr:DegT/DnrJ/EryC1/StrS family aminotransferase [SAR324 cluster bacterium]
MQVPLLDLKGQLRPLRDEILAAIVDVLDSTQYIMGPKVEELERAVAQYSGCSHALGVSSGTDALLLALMGLNVGPGDLVITSTFSFFATAGVIARLNATPVLTDIDPVTFNMSPAHLSEILKAMPEDTRNKVKAIIPVHLYGQCADMQSLMKVAAQWNIPVIEDAAQAIGAEYPLEGKVQRAGSMGKMGCFSFFPSKNLGGIGDGGMIVTNDSTLAQYLVYLRNHGANPKYYHKFIGGNFRLDPLQAAVLNVKLPHLDQWHQQRQRNANRYIELFSKAGIAEVALPAAVYQTHKISNYHIYNQFMIRVPQRDELRQFLQSQQIVTEVYYPVPFHVQECFSYLNYKSGDFPESEKAAREVLALPIYPELTEEMQAHVVQQIKAFYQERKTL